MPTTRRFVIVGAGLAGAKAAETLREEGFDGEVVLLGAEAERPYERPPLSKEYLRRESEREKIYVHEEGFYEERGIDLRTRTVVEAIEPSSSEVVLAGGERLSYDALLIATGSAPRRIDVPGVDLLGVRYLREARDSDELHELIRESERLVVVGAGWIGCEVAASARQLGASVTMVEPLEVPLERVLGAQVGALYADVHREHGVELLTGVGVERFEGDGRVRRVVLSDGRALDCDLVVVGVGAVARVALAEQAGLAVEAGGILVDASLRTSVANVFAAGDVASELHPLTGERVRVEHWANALNQGPAAARAMLGQPVSYDRVPYFFSDQYDVGMEYSGWPSAWDEVVFRGDVGARELIAFWVLDGRVVAGMNMNVWDVTEQIRRLVLSGERVDRDRLADPDTPLEQLAGAASGG
ncbi:MAG: FAD-dependent oxidoreductase [Thermoleophilaceae bacterium]|nr:FAD-dependent oxidoreductase [Thermoleophilaceae bacterium]